MKVKSTRQNAIEIRVSCRNCGYSETGDCYGKPFLERRDIVTNMRSKARYHVQKTGHEVEVEVTHIAVYKLMDGEK